MRKFLTAGLIGATLGAVAATAQAEPRPAVVELFTSEGCSSCPPAEMYLGELAQRSDVLALSFHVDYWDNLGWRDRFGVAEATPRQRLYARSLRLSSVYTPQMVIDGNGDFVGTDRLRIAKALAMSRSGVPIAITVGAGAVGIDVASQKEVARCDVLLVAFQSSAVSAIGRGENSGRTLTEYNIVRTVRSLGPYAGVARTYRAELESLPKEATDVAVLVQALGQGSIVGAARLTLRGL